MNQHVFFQEFGMPGGRQQAQPPNKEQQKYLYNCMILEISTNWESVRELMYKYRNKLLDQVDKISAEWINFIVQNNIDIIKYGDEEENKFIEENIH